MPISHTREIYNSKGTFIDVHSERKSFSKKPAENYHLG